MQYDNIFVIDRFEKISVVSAYLYSEIAITEASYRLWMIDYTIIQFIHGFLVSLFFYGKKKQISYFTQ